MARRFLTTIFATLCLCVAGAAGAAPGAPKKAPPKPVPLPLFPAEAAWTITLDAPPAADAAMDDDLNVPAALAVLHEHVTVGNTALAHGSDAAPALAQVRAMLDVLGSDFLRTARAKGLRRSHALIKHGLRTALIPMATFFAYQFALLFVGATFTEKIFGWHGMGEYFVDSVTKNDVNSVAAVTLFVADMARSVAFYDAMGFRLKYGGPDAAFTSYFVGEADKRAIEAHMTNLRRKLGDNPANPRYIETVRGVGYTLRPA